MRLINADELKESFIKQLAIKSEDYLLSQEKRFCDLIDSTPTVEVKLVKHGTWKRVHYHDDSSCHSAWRLMFRCPFCGYREDEYFVSDGIQYCRRCGNELEVDDDQNDFIEMWWGEDDEW